MNVTGVSTQDDTLSLIPPLLFPVKLLSLSLPDSLLVCDIVPSIGSIRFQDQL